VTEPQGVPNAAVEVDACPRCGAEYQPGQEYCLECGARLPETEGVVRTISSRWRDRPWYPGDWIWPVLVGLLVAGLATAVAIAVRDAGGQGTTVVATQPAGTVGPPPAPEPPPPEPTTTPEPPAPTEPPAPPPARSNEILAWPDDTSGFTVVLESIPTTAGRALANRKARAAQKAGLEEVGVLNSSRYASLHPGYFVVFTGIFDSMAAAQPALETAQANGYSAAYARQITS
jgi:zinc-ribbon domain